MLCSLVWIFSLGRWVLGEGVWGGWNLFGLCMQWVGLPKGFICSRGVHTKVLPQT